jgi:hypothetical protein
MKGKSATLNVVLCMVFCFALLMIARTGTAEEISPFAASYTLTAGSDGLGMGTISSGPSGIDCGGICEASFTADSIVKLTAAAFSGSVFSGWGGDAAACGTNSSCSITMGAARNVTASFAPSCGVNFSDVASGHWAEKFIGTLACSKITSGCGNGDYCPDGYVTRAQMAVFIVKALGQQPAESCAGTAFGDVNPAMTGGEGFCRYIEKFQELNITSGCGNGNYCPDDPVTRSQMAVFITKALGQQPAESCAGTVFGDVNPAMAGGEGFCRYTEKFKELNITSGCGGGNYCPDDSVTRSQMAVFLAKGFLNWNADQETFNVVWSPDTTLIDEAHLGLLKNADNVNYRYTFDAAGVSAAGLDLSVGRVLVIHGLALRRISSVSAAGGDMVVDTQYATLNEAITDGIISWDHGIDFFPGSVQSLEIDGNVIPMAEAVPIHVEFAYGDYNYIIDIQLMGEKGTFKFTVKKEIAAGLGAEFVAEGEIGRFRSKNKIAIAGGVPQQFDHNYNRLQGDATLSLVVAGSGNDAVNLKLPVVLMKIPFMVGVVPVVLDIKAQFVINAVVPIDGSAQVSAKFTYDSDLGLKFAGSNLAANGRLGPYTISTDSPPQTGASSAIGVNFGVGFPRVGLGIFGEVIGGWAQTAFLIGGSYTFYPACQTADTTFLGAMGYDVGFLGFNLASGSKTLFQEVKPLLKSGNCP